MLCFFFRTKRKGERGGVGRVSMEQEELWGRLAGRDGEGKGVVEDGK